MCPSNVAWDGTECFSENLTMFSGETCRADVCSCFQNGPPIQTFVWKIRQVPPDGCRSIGNGYGVVGEVHKAVARREAAKHGTCCVPPETRTVKSASTTRHYDAGGDVKIWFNCLNGGYCEGEFEVTCNADDPAAWPVVFRRATVDKCGSDSTGPSCQVCHATCPWLTSGVPTAFPIDPPPACQ